jgi:hypothetical protein
MAVVEKDEEEEEEEEEEEGGGVGSKVILGNGDDNTFEEGKEGWQEDPGNVVNKGEEVSDGGELKGNDDEEANKIKILLK